MLPYGVARPQRFKRVLLWETKKMWHLFAGALLLFRTLLIKRIRYVRELMLKRGNSGVASLNTGYIVVYCFFSTSVAQQWSDNCRFSPPWGCQIKVYVFALLLYSLQWLSATLRVTPFLQQWSYCSRALSHWFYFHVTMIFSVLSISRVNAKEMKVLCFCIGVTYLLHLSKY